MTTKLDKILKREISIKDKPYILTFSPDGLKITEKGRRNGHETTWAALIHGEAASAQLDTDADAAEDETPE